MVCGWVQDMWLQDVSGLDVAYTAYFKGIEAPQDTFELESAKLLIWREIQPDLPSSLSYGNRGLFFCAYFPIVWYVQDYKDKMNEAGRLYYLQLFSGSEITTLDAIEAEAQHPRSANVFYICS